MKYGNDTDIVLSLKRIDLCNLLIACTNTKYGANDGGKKWQELHDKIEKILDAADNANGIT